MSVFYFLALSIPKTEAIPRFDLVDSRNMPGG
jgi:hypothetical protein